MNADKAYPIPILRILTNEEINAICSPLYQFCKLQLLLL